MRKSSYAVTLLSVCLFTTLAHTQTLTEQVPSLVVPSQIATAHTIFLAYGGAPVLGLREPEFRSAIFGGAQAALSAGAHVQFVGTPSEADLDCVISLESKNSDVTQGTSFAYPFVQLAVFDPKSHALLWNLQVPLDGAFRKATFERNVKKAMGELVKDYNTIAAGKLPAA